MQLSFFLLLSFCAFSPSSSNQYLGTALKLSAIAAVAQVPVRHAGPVRRNSPALTPQPATDGRKPPPAAGPLSGLWTHLARRVHGTCNGTRGRYNDRITNEIRSQATPAMLSVPCP